MLKSNDIAIDQDYIIQMFRYLDSNKIQAQAGKSFDFKDRSFLTSFSLRELYNLKALFDSPCEIKDSI